MANKSQKSSVDFEFLKAMLDDSNAAAAAAARTNVKAQKLPVPNKNRRISSQDTQIIAEASDDEEENTSDDAATRSKVKTSSPATSLQGHDLDLEPTQSSPIRRPESKNPPLSDSQLPETLQTDTGVDKSNSIHLDFSPEKAGGFSIEDTQADSDSYQERLRRNAALETQHSDGLVPLNSDRLYDSPSQHRVPVYFDERKRFSTGLGLIANVPGDGSDDEDGVRAIKELDNESLPLGLTQMFEASSPQRPVTGSSAIPTSPRLGLTSPAVPKSPFVHVPPPSAKKMSANHYITTDESQAARDKRNKKLAIVDPADDEFGAIPPALGCRVRNRQRERDSVEMFKEISVERPAPPAKVPGRRGRPPKNRPAQPALLPSVPESSHKTSPVQNEPIVIEDSHEKALSEKDSLLQGDEDGDLEVPGTMEAAVTEVKKTQSSQHRPGSHIRDIEPASSDAVIADSQPETTARVAAEIQSATQIEVTKMVGTSSSFDRGPRRNRNKRNLRTIQSSSPERSSNTRTMSSSPPPTTMSHAPDKITEIVEDTPRPLRARNQTKTVPLSVKPKTPYTNKKLAIPSTIPATSPYGGDAPLSNLDTPVPVGRRKRKADQEVPSSFEGVPIPNSSTSEIIKSPGATAEAVITSTTPKAKRSRPNSVKRGTQASEGLITPSRGLQRRPIDEDDDEGEETDVDTEEDENPFNPGEAASPTEMEVSTSPPPPQTERPSLKLNTTTTPQKATIPFRPTDSEKRELNTTTPIQVFAWWGQKYWPAIVPDWTNRYDNGTPTRVVGADETVVRFDRMKKLELHPGDLVKVDGDRKVWQVVETFKSSEASGSQHKTESQVEREEIRDIHGNDMVRLKRPKAEETTEAFIGGLVLTAGQFNALKPETIAVEHGTATQDFTPRVLSKEDSILDTPSKQSKRSTPSFISDGQKLKPSKSFLGAKARNGIFAGMRFAISLPSKGDADGDRRSIANLILRHGGELLENGFDEIFEPITPTAGNPIEGSGLIARDWADDVVFAAVITRRYNTTPKYLQALALGLPCLAVKWLEDSIATGMALPWQDYLLPAGESQYFDGVVKSRVIEWIDLKDATFANLFSRRRKLMEGMNVVFHDTTRKKSETDPYVFLIHSLAPSHFYHAKSVEEVNNILKASGGGKGGRGSDEKITWHFVFSREGKDNYKTRKARNTLPVRVVSDEWLKQSLILGKLIDE